MMEITGNEEELIYEDFDTRAEILQQCYNAIASVESIDTYLNKQVKKKEEVKAKCLDVIHYYICEIHAEIFDENGNE